MAAVGDAGTADGPPRRNSLIFGDSPQEAADLSHRYAEAGVGLGIVVLPRPLDPADVERYADSLQTLR